jgi:hypothetical protein
MFHLALLAVDHQETIDFNKMYLKQKQEVLIRIGLNLIYIGIK